MLTEEGRMLFNRLLDKYYFAENKLFYCIFGKKLTADDFVLADYTPEKIYRGINHKNSQVHTVVIWSDGSKTEVNQMNGDPDDAYTAFCAALAKKTFGSTSRTKKHVRNAVKNSYKRQKQ